MPSWSQAKVDSFRDQFYQFLGYVKINSKDLGQVILGDHVYESQHRLLNAIFGGLGRGIHDIKHLKSRQLGISTLTWAFDLFWLGMFDGLNGVLILDTDFNKENARSSLVMMLDSLPKHLKFPSRDKAEGGSSNRYMLKLSNQSTLSMLSAGVSERKTGGGLGRSLGVNFVHACMHPDTPVIVEHGRIKKIKDIIPGDKVFTHNGKETTVIANSKLNNDRGPMVKITPWLNEPFYCTKDHKIMTERGLIPAGKLKKADRVIMPIRQIMDFNIIPRLPSTVRKNNNSGSISAGAGKQVNFNEDFGFAIGYYLAEGTIIYQGRGENYGKNPSGLTFARHRSEKNYADRAIKELEKYTTGSRRTYDVPGKLTTTETIYSASLARWIEDNFGSLDEKRIPDWVFFCGFKFCRGLFLGMLAGDGSKTENHIQGYEVNRVNLTTTRSSLATQMRDLGASLGFGWCALRHREAGNYYGRNCKLVYTLSWCGSAAKKIREAMGFSTVDQKTAWIEKYEILDGQVLLKLKHLEFGFEVPVMHDLAVEHSEHTFRLAQCSVSNSEMCSWSNVEGLEAFRNSLSTIYDNRYYCWESTGRGFNSWYDMWKDALEDPHHQVTHFTGWWGKNSQRISRQDPDFGRYGWVELSPEENERCKDVLDRYGWTISLEQLAWYRRHMDPGAPERGEKMVEASSLQLLEQPWTADDAFQTGDSIFFDPKALTTSAKTHCSNKHKNFYYYCGVDFLNMKITPAANHRSIMLKVWEDPDPDGIYIVSVDPAFGANESNDRSCIQILRCYSDGLDQVAEYAWPLINTEQLAWVIAHLLGWYMNCYLVIEINGPGDAVWRYLKNMKRDVQRGMMMGIPLSDEFENIFANVKNFIYTKSDTMFAGRALMMKTSGDLKVTLLEELRDFTQNGMLHIRSLSAIDEMKTVERKGDTIKASGANKDDRVLALSFAVHYWADSIRAKLSQQKLTRENVIAKRRLTVRDMYSTFTSYQVKDLFDRKKNSALAARRAAIRSGRRFS